MTVTPFNGAEEGRTHYIGGGNEDYNRKSPTPITSPPHSDTQYLLYESQGNIYSVPINKALNTDESQQSKVVDSSVVGAGFVGFDTVWDGVNNEWIIIASIGETPSDIVMVAVSESDNNWTVRGTSTLYSGVMDGGPSCYLNGGGGLFFGAVDSSDRDILLWEIEDFSARPLPSSPDNGPHTWMQRMFGEVDPVNIQLMQIDSRTLGCLYESSSNGGWSTQIAYGRMPLSGGFAVSSESGEGAGALTSRHIPIAVNGIGNADNWTHAQYSNELGRPLIFCQVLSSKGTSELDFGLYAYEVSSQELFNPAGNLPMSAKVLNNAGAGTESKRYPTFGADEVRVYVQGGDTGTLTMHEMPNFESGFSDAERTQSVSGNHYLHTWESPGAYVSFEVDVATTRVSIEIV